MPIEIQKDKWPGSIKAVTIGATAAEGGTRTSTITVGGQTTLPYLQFEAPTPNKPVIAIEIKSRKPEDWSQLLLDVWGDAMNDPATWAKKAEEAGASLIVLELALEDSADDAKAIIAEATDVVTAKVSHAFDSTADYSSEVWSDIKAAARNAIDYTDSTFTNLWNSATSWFTE